MDTNTPGNYHATATSAGQSLIASDLTGASVAVAYDAKDGPLLAAAPELLRALERILYADDNRGNGAAMGEAVLCREYASMARAAIASAKGE